MCTLRTHAKFLNGIAGTEVLFEKRTQKLFIRRLAAAVSRFSLGADTRNALLEHPQVAPRPAYVVY